MQPASDASASEKRPATSNSPNERRLHSASASRSHSTGNRFSIASTETGESSRSGSTRASTLLDNVTAGDNDTSREEQRNLHSTMNMGSRDAIAKPSHRSRQSKNNGGFLLSNTAFGIPASSEHTSSRHSTSTNRPSDGTRDTKGKSSREEKKRKSGIGLGIVGSPLASNVTGSGSGEQTEVDASNLRNRDHSQKEISQNSQGSSTGLDIDSAQIVNLALNLSENRKLAARRNISTPIPTSTPAFEEALAGGSLKYHMQQQRRSSRNISPKPDKVDRIHTTSPRLITAGQRTNSGFRGSSSAFPDAEYHYYFSPSTLARADKARNSIELMAQYRRLLQYVPPLKPTGTSLSQTYPTPPGTSSTSPGSTNFATSRPVSAASSRPLGRPYNPLQYIRNRKLRARERRTLDGESEGFHDIDKVKAWVDQISSESVQQAYGTSDIVPIPSFSGATIDSSHEPLQASITKNSSQSKYKRPRMDWAFTPEDLLSDLHWLEQGDNKKSIEDREGRKIFPQKTPLKRPMSRDSQTMSEATAPTIKSEGSVSDYRMEAELPKFKSVKSETTRGRARQKLHDTIHGHPRNSGSFSESHWKNRSESDFSRSEDESRFRRAGRSKSREPAEPGRSLLEKQMMELLAKEARERDISTGSTGNEYIPMQTVESQSSYKDKVSATNSAGSSIYSAKLFRPTSHKQTDSKDYTSGRQSLEVPGARTSTEWFDSTAPNSPLAKAANPDGHIPGISMNLSPSPSRAGSPTRKPLQRVKSKINKLRDRSRHPTNSTERFSIEEERPHDASGVPATPDSPELRKRSTSPTKKLLNSKTDSSSKSLRREGSMRQKKGEDDSSGLRSFIKGSRDIVRGPVLQVKDFLTRKDTADSSTSSSEDSDNEITLVKKSEKKKRNDSAPNDVDESTPEVGPTRSYLKDMPSFRLSRNRSTSIKIKEAPQPTQDNDHVTRQHRALSNARSPRFDLLKPPRIDVQSASPSSSPDFPPIRQVSHESDISDDVDSRRSSYVPGADAKLNAILGLPGHLKSGPPVTALAQTSLERGHLHEHSHSQTQDDGHRPSIGNRQWSISDRAPSNPRGPITKREIARVRALLLSSGVKAKEIARREEELIDIRDPSKSAFSEIATTMLPSQYSNKLAWVPKHQEHDLAARILTNDIQISSRLWQDSATEFTSSTIPNLTSRIQALKESVTGPEGLTAMCRRSADEADALGRDLVGEKTMAVKRLTDAMEMMERRRRRRFRWVRRGGWVLLEWVLVGVMWWAWLVVVLVRGFRGVGGAVVGGLRWLFWL